MTLHNRHYTPRLVRASLKSSWFHDLACVFGTLEGRLEGDVSEVGQLYNSTERR